MTDTASVRTVAAGPVASSEIRLKDIGRGLSRRTRWIQGDPEAGPRPNVYYSMAEHAWHVAMQCPAELRLAGLLHDGASAYLPDDFHRLYRGAVQGLPLELAAIGEYLEEAIAARFGLALPMPAAVEVAHARVTAYEYAELLDDPGRLEALRARGQDLPVVHVRPCSPSDVAYSYFMMAARGHLNARELVT